MAIRNAGLLGSVSLSAMTMAQPYTVPADRFASYTVTFCNRGTAQALIRLALATSGTVSNSQYLEYDTPLPVGASLQVTGIAGPGNRISAYSDLANVTCVVAGLEEDIA